MNLNKTNDERLREPEYNFCLMDNFPLCHRSCDFHMIAPSASFYFLIILQED